MKILSILLASLVLCGALAARSEAASCWRVTGWSSPSPGAIAIIVPASCKTVPINFSWAQVGNSNGAPLPEDLWFIFDLNDSRIEGRFLQGVLFFDHFDVLGKPVVMLMVDSAPVPATTQLWPIPPMQGALPAGTVVRLRQVSSGNCLRNTNVYEPTIPNYMCSHDLKLSYVLDIIDGKLRLRNEATNQCLYATSGGNLLYSAACSSSPAMQFTLYGVSGGYRLRHVETNKCVIGNAVSGDYVHTAACVTNPEMIYQLDVIHY